MSHWIAGFYTETGERYVGHAPDIVTDRIDKAVRYVSEDLARAAADGYASGAATAEGFTFFLPLENITGTFTREVE